MSDQIEIVFVRHGQSEWNLQNRFTGWADVPLTPHGEQEATLAGKILSERNWRFDCAFTSVLRRSIQTAWRIMFVLELEWLPIHKDWRLNERHYGSLQGLKKQEVTQQYGSKMVTNWRRGFLTKPPPSEGYMNESLKKDPRYQKLGDIPTGESLKDTMERVVQWWDEIMIPALRRGQRPLVCAHGNSLRALIKYLDEISDEEVVGLNIPTGMPFVYRLSRSLKPMGYSFLADESELVAAMHEVRNQAG